MSKNAFILFTHLIILTGHRILVWEVKIIFLRILKALFYCLWIFKVVIFASQSLPWDLVFCFLMHFRYLIFAHGILKCQLWAWVLSHSLYFVPDKPFQYGDYLSSLLGHFLNFLDNFLFSSLFVLFVKNIYHLNTELLGLNLKFS